MSICVTGATGTVGSEVIRQLTAAGHRVRAFVHAPERTASIEGPLVEIVRGGFFEPDTLRAALAGIEKVLLIAPIHPAMVEMEGRVIDAAGEAGVRHVVKVSGMASDAQSPARLGRMERASERRLEESGIAWTHLRPSGFMTAFLGFAETIKSRGVLAVPAGNGRACPIDPRDIGAVCVKALTESGHEGEVHLVTGPEALTYAQAAERLSAAAGRRISYVDIPADAARRGMLESGMSEWLADVFVEVFALIKADRLATVTDTVERLTGKTPRTFDQWASEHAPAFA